MEKQRAKGGVEEVEVAIKGEMGKEEVADLEQ
jgi:hypothetical protein